MDYLKELVDRYGFEPESEAILMAYNMGDYGARKAWESGINTSSYSTAILALMSEYEQEVKENAASAGVETQ